MQTQTLIYIILAGIAALLVALLQYVYKSQKRKRLYIILAFLRFITVFSILLLLINPKFNAITYYDEKPNLIVAIDNSESVSHLKQEDNVKTLYETLQSNSVLRERFNIEYYKFGDDFEALDSLSYATRQTNISNVFKGVSEIYKNTTSPVLLISDGNQTYGADYQYTSTKVGQPIFPVILGDTTQYSDLRIQQLNVNRYVYLRNQFPVEVFANYSGTGSVRSQLRIWSGNSVVFSKEVNLSTTKTSEIISTSLPANRVGVQSYRIELAPLENEKNTVNNYKNFAVEVIDQKTNIALISERIHPDLGAIKKSIETNEQRSVSLLTPREALDNLEDYQLIILYQPNTSFGNVLEAVERLKLNTFTITGNTTNWTLLNASQAYFQQEVTNQSEDFQPNLNTSYNPFIIDDLAFDDFPPLESEFGELTFLVPNETILFKTVNGNNLNSPLLSTFEVNDQKHAVLSGEGIWRWRAQAYLDKGGFQEFDNFMGKLVQYLSSNKKRRRISVDYKSFYNGNDNLIISAQYFNKNYEFDNSATLILDLKNATTNTSQSYPLLLNTNSYSIDLSGIEAGDYTFTLKHTSEPISISGNFKVLEYNVEQQFLNADVTKLEAVATNTNGKSYFIDNASSVINDLMEDKRFVTIQKENKNVVPLIDWSYLLALIALSLSLEWFLRKYNGLI